MNPLQIFDKYVYWCLQWHYAPYFVLGGKTNEFTICRKDTRS